MTQHRPVLHQTAGLIELLAAGDVVLVNSTGAGLADHFVGHRHRRGVGAVGQDAHHQETENQHQGDGLDPALAD